MLRKLFVIIGVVLVLIGSGLLALKSQKGETLTWGEFYQIHSFMFKP